MAAGTAEAHMEELVDQGLGMEETAHDSLLRRPSLKEIYHSDSLLAPDTDFMTGTEFSLDVKGPIHPNYKNNQPCFY